ncbi:MFS transporter [Anabaena azotica]|uniref:MFS transporter n=1 Tax=Anabaena azotica FACHB-119 TaxID=947527 RepID=A0ABR8DEK9_9NOST|nr:MFS transporter [Anabaena azotica]MBD2504143.1 MFS transporter [Anabaena azotica FACHB-119]
MNSQEQTALTTGNQSLSKRSTVLMLAIANVDYNQPLLGNIGRSLEIPVKQVGFIPFLTQIGYATSLLLLVPLDDRMERRNLITTMLGLLSWALVAEAVSPNLIWLSIASLALGVCSIVAHLLLPLVAYMTASAERGKVIGTLVSGMILIVLLARTVSGAIGEHFGWRWMRSPQV